MPPPCVEFETTTYEIVARLRKTGLVPALDWKFWSNKTNGEAIWSQIILLMNYEKWVPEAEEDVAGEEKKEEEGGKRRKKKKKKDSTTESAQGTPAPDAKLLKLTIPHHVSFMPTPHHEESDKTIRIGGLLEEDVHQEKPLPPMQGMEDYYTCVTYGYELAALLSLKDGEVYANKKKLGEDGGEDKDPAITWSGQMYDAQPPLSMRVSGKIGFHQLCPGAVSVGKRGLWWPTNTREGQYVENEDRMAPKETTRPVAVFTRDAVLSSSNGVLVNCVLALESPLLSPLLMSWDPSNEAPPPTPHLEVECKVPMFMNTPNTLLHHPLESNLNERTAPVIYVLTKAELPPDFEIKAPHGTAEKHKRRRKMFIVKEGFRNKVLTRLLVPDDIIPPYVFGVTKKGAQHNRTGVNGRNMWHSEQRCVEQLCRVRGPIDYM